MAQSPADGVKVFPIAGRTVRQRERLIGMTDAERAWRAQWLKDQILSPEEPIVPKDYYKLRYNPIRRFYRAPMELLERFLCRYMGEMPAKLIRHTISKSGLGLIGMYCLYYNVKYHKNDWTRKGGFRVTFSRPAMYPNNPNFPNYEERSEFYTLQFENSPI